MKNVLIPTDFSENSWKAVQYAVRFFKNKPCNFYILHVGDVEQSPKVGNSFAPPGNNYHSGIKTDLKNFFGRTERLGLCKCHHFIALLEYGDFIEQVRKTVDDKKIDLIVMGSRGASGLKRCILGSNTGNVLVKVSCNTLVVPKKAKFAGPGKIIFPTDCNIFYSHRILEGISDIILCCDAQLQILNILKRNGILSLVQEQNKLYLKDYLEELYADSFDFRNITGTKILTAIEHTAANGNIGMIMMVAKNLNILEKVFIDSTIQRLRFHSRVPLMVLHG